MSWFLFPSGRSCQNFVWRLLGCHYIFLLFFSLLVTKSLTGWENKVLWDQGKNQLIILQKSDTLIDGQRWVEAVRSHVQYLPQSLMMLIRNTCLPFHFNDVPPLQEWPRHKEVLIIFFSAVRSQVDQIVGRCVAQNNTTEKPCFCVTLMQCCVILIILKGSFQRKSGHFSVHALQSFSGHLIPT